MNAGGETFFAVVERNNKVYKVFIYSVSVLKIAVLQMFYPWRRMKIYNAISTLP